MAKTTTREIERFKATSEDGKTHTVIVVQSFIDVGTLEDPSAEKPGLKSAHTAEGLTLNHKPNNQFEIVQTGVILTRV